MGNMVNNFDVSEISLSSETLGFVVLSRLTIVIPKFVEMLNIKGLWWVYDCTQKNNVFWI